MTTNQTSAAGEGKRPRGTVKRFREHLNRQFANSPLWKHHGNRGQRKQPYGDYLYAADREMFMHELAEWLKTNPPHPCRKGEGKE